MIMRAGIALQLLSEMHQVTVVHVGLCSGYPEIVEETWVRNYACAYHFVPVPVAAGAAQELVSRHLSRTEIEGVYVFRQASAPLALQTMGLLANSKMPSVLDLDDDECTRTEMLIPLREAAGDFARANRERTELGRQRRFQRMILSRFQTCFLASSEDRDSLSAQYPDVKFAWLPNAIRLPAETPGLHGGPRGNLLFLGKLDYLPNEDAVLYFCNRILPLLITSGRPVSLRVAGMDAPDSIRKLSALPGVTVVGAVKDVVPEYERAGIAVAPLRAGSGTRIKILEAFSYGVPVVSTSMGAAGLDVTHEVHLLIADTPEEFAAACLRLIEDDRLAERLSRNALKWVRETHSLDRVRAILHGIFSAQ